MGPFSKPQHTHPGIFILESPPPPAPRTPSSRLPPPPPPPPSPTSSLLMRLFSPAGSSVSFTSGALDGGLHVEECQFSDCNQISDFFTSTPLIYIYFFFEFSSLERVSHNFTIDTHFKDFLLDCFRLCIETDFHPCMVHVHLEILILSTFAFTQPLKEQK